MRTRGSKSGVKNETPKLPETRESLEKIVIFLLLKSNFPHTNPIFLTRNSIFFNGFPLSSTAFRFLWRLSDFFNVFLIFLNGFLLSKKSEKIYLRRQVYERSLFKLRIFRHFLPELCNSRLLIAIHHTALQVLKACMLKCWSSLCSTVNNTDCNMMH